MPVIKIQTCIAAPVTVVFDLARSIDLHKISTAHTKEQAVAGKTSGLIGSGERVTWHARHFGIVQQLTSEITRYSRPFYFTDEMVKGAFKSFVHDHIFEENNQGVIMTDVFTYKSPLFVLGIMADFLFLKRYMKNLLVKRNAIIKEFAENPDKYRQVLIS